MMLNRLSEIETLDETGQLHKPYEPIQKDKNSTNGVDRKLAMMLNQMAKFKHFNPQSSFYQQVRELLRKGTIIGTVKQLFGKIRALNWLLLFQIQA